VISRGEMFMNLIKMHLPLSTKEATCMLDNQNGVYNFLHKGQESKIEKGISVLNLKENKPFYISFF